MDKQLNMTELGHIIIANVPREQIESGYGVSPDDPAAVGRQALLWNDINADGTLN